MLFPKFHKLTLSQRFVVSYANCTVKPITHRLDLELKAVYCQISSYSRMLYKVTRLKRNWIIDNNRPILHCFDSYRETDANRNVSRSMIFRHYTRISGMMRLKWHVKMSLN